MPFYKELAERVLEFEDELIAILREMQGARLKTDPIKDDLSRSERVAFTEIDPYRKRFVVTYRSEHKLPKFQNAWRLGLGYLLLL